MPVTQRSIGRRISRIFLYLSYVIIVVLLMLELTFRYQLIDFYRGELTTRNNMDMLHESGQTVLVFGDSFTVQDSSWLNQLRKDLPDFNIVNSAITGSSAIEASYMAPGRIRNFNPDILIYQIYVGNDLLGIRHQLNWQKWSPQRNIYWWVSDYFHVIAWFNYKLGQVRWKGPSSAPEPTVALPEEKFNAACYREREQMLARGEPDLISNSTLLKNGRDEDIEDLSSRIKEMISLVKPDCKIYLLLIPHKAQVNEYYRGTMEAIGFEFDPNFADENEDYPFIEKLKADFKSNPSVEIINPLIPLRENDSHTNRTFYIYDEHLTSAGQKVVKDLVLDTMK